MDRALADPGTVPSADLLATIVEQARDAGDDGVAELALTRLVVAPDFRKHLGLLPADLLAEVIEKGRLTFGPT